MNVAIIGANGFIGKHLTEYLESTTSDNLFLYGRKEHSENLHSKAIYKKLDLSNKATIVKDFGNIDIVFYLASASIPASTWNNPLEEIEKNLIPFIQFLEALAATKCRKIAFVSSAGTIYGPTDGKVKEEGDKKPFSPYGIVKLSMENFLNYYQVKYQFNIDVYRISNVYGEGQDISKGLGIINIFLEKIYNHGKVTVYGDGSITRNFIYVGDVVRLLALSLEHINSSNTYNLSSNDTVNINTLIEVMKKAINIDFEVNYVDGRQSDNSFIDLDNQKIKQHAPTFQFTTIQEGIQRTFSNLSSKQK